MGMGQGRGAVGTLCSGSVFSSFGLCEAWLGDLETGRSLTASGISQAAFDTGQSPGLGAKSGRQNSPVLREEIENKRVPITDIINHSLTQTGAVLAVHFLNFFFVEQFPSQE